MIFSVVIMVFGMMMPTSEAWDFRVGFLPNGTVNNCANCHINPGGGGARNAFGLAVQALVTPGGQQQFWGSALAAVDSDGDGASNGVELQDPSGIWQAGSAAPGNAALVTNPGDSNSVPAQAGNEFPGLPEANGLMPKTDRIFINLPDTVNNDSTESLGVAIASNGNIIVGWEDDGDDLTDLEAVWTLFDANGNMITPDTTITSTQSDDTLTSKFLSYFRADGSAVPGNTAWGPKIKANLFGEGVGMGATAFSLGLEIEELADINIDAGGGGDFPAVQLLTNDGRPIATLSGVDDAYAEPEGDIRIGDWDYLSNGHVVIVGESRQQFDLQNVYGGAPGNHAIYRIVNQAGNEVRSVGLVSEAAEITEIWHGVGVTQNGFGVRFSRGGRATVRLFNNAGEPVSEDIDIGLLTENEATIGGGRGDGAGFHGNGVDAYAIVNSNDGDGNGGREVYLSVLDADGSLRYSRIATDDFEYANADRVDCAISPSGRVIVVWADNDVTGGASRLVQGRLFDAQGNPEGGSFFVSEKETIDTFIGESRRPRVAWRGNTIAIVWESKNSAATSSRIVALRVFEVEGETAVTDYSLY
jgi:hypothetical protein